MQFLISKNKNIDEVVINMLDVANGFGLNYCFNETDTPGELSNDYRNFIFVVKKEDLIGCQSNKHISAIQLKKIFNELRKK